MRRTHQQWQALVQQQRESEGSIKDFCFEQGVSASAFYKHKAQLLTHSETLLSSPFSQVVSIKPETLTPAHSINLNIGNVRLTFDSHTDVNWLARLIGQLA